MTQFFISFSTGCILLGTLYIICPEGNLSKPIKHIFSLVFLVIIISAANIPFQKIDFSLPTINDSNNQNYVDMQTYAAEYVYSAALKNQNINFSKISIFTDKSADGSIVITKVVITSNDTKEKILKAISGIGENREVEIINE